MRRSLDQPVLGRLRDRLGSTIRQPLHKLLRRLRGPRLFLLRISRRQPNAPTFRQRIAGFASSPSESSVSAWLPAQGNNEQCLATWVARRARADYTICLRLCSGANTCCPDACALLPLVASGATR